MLYTPYYYNEINLADTFNRPSSVKSRNNISFGYWERALFERAMFNIDVTLPDIWQGKVKDFIMFVLFRRGFAMVADSAEFGKFCQPCEISGYDFYYQPTEAILSNPKLSRRYKIGKECALLKLTPDYKGVWDIIDRYAEQLSTLDNALNMSLINSKFAWLFGAKNKGAASAIKKAMDRINRGEPLVVYDQRISDDQQSKSEPFQYVDFKVKNNYITTDLLADLSTILRDFDTEIGIPTVPYEKKERLVTDEATARQTEAIARATIWIETINESAKDIKELFPDIDISAKLRVQPEEGADNELNDNEPTGAL